MIKTNSKLVLPGDIFIALKGNKLDGHDFIEEAIKNGAATIIAEYGNYSVKTKIVKDTYKYLVKQLKQKYYKKIKHINLIGITGTNGKTTTAYLLYQSLNRLNIKTAYIGTIGFYKDKKIRNLKNTTPDILELYEILLECIDCEYVVMEVSSQGLAMNRLGNLKFSIAVLTNITQDHLDYHKTMDNYALAKAKLFTKLNHKKIAIINNDSKYKELFILSRNKNFLYGIEGNYKISDISVCMDGNSFKINNITYQSNLIGKHNIYNLSVVIIILNILNINVDKIKKVTTNLNQPDGRLDKIEYKNNLIFIDYAHTPDAVLNVIKTIREIKPNHIYTIIGCGGNRDKTKRPIMGSIANDYSDYTFFTSDNPRNEDPKQIINDMVKNIDNKKYKKMLSREKAIKKGIQKLDKNDILLILGKGHEDYQIIKDKIIAFSDKLIVQKYI